MSKRKNISRNVSGFATNPVDRAMYDGVDTEETDALFSALSEIERGGNAPTAITPADDGTMQLAGWQMTPTGLVPPANIAKHEYRDFGSRLFQMDSAMQWYIGDFINLGDQFQWGETYQQLAEETGKEIKTLYEYAYVARSVEISIRMETLSFSHHQVVAKMEPDEQRYWLERAADEGLSRAKFKAAIKEAQLPPPPSDDKQPHEYSPIHQDLTAGLQRGAAVNVPNAGAGTVAEVRGNFAFVDLDDGGRAIADLDDLTPPTPPPPPPPPPTVENASTVQAQSFDHGAFTQAQAQWDEARVAFNDVRVLHIQHVRMGSTRNQKKTARQKIRDLIAHLQYIESTLGD